MAGQRQRQRAAASPAGQRRRAAADPAADSHPGSGLTIRAVVLAVVVCALLLMLAYPLREYLAQRAEIERTQQTLTAQRAQVNALRAANQRWQDPGYVEAAARTRLHFVLPGETSYVVLDPHSPTTDEDPGVGQTAGASTGGDDVTAGEGDVSGVGGGLMSPPELTPPGEEDTWVSRLWASTRAAAQTP